MSGKKKNVAILFGGKSVEHSVSINSAKNIYQYINRELFNPLLIGIDREGNWFQCHGFEKPIDRGTPIDIRMSYPAKFMVEGTRLNVDLAFPVIHGTNGEDGSIQGLLQIMGIPYVGTSILGSSLCMSKLLTKEVLTAHNISNTPFMAFNSSQRDQINFEEVEASLGMPVMVKAANLGSSVGINKAHDRDSFYKAIEDSFKFDHQLLIEKFIPAREIECAVKGNENPEVSFPGEIVISKEYEFYSFDAKYVDGAAVNLEIPAKMDEDVRGRIMEACRQAYLALKCNDYARVDVFLTTSGEFFINEINTIPGFTNASMFPMMWKQHDVSFTDLITQLIGLAEERYRKGKDIETSYFSKLDN